MAIDLNLKSLNNIPWYGQLGIFSVFGIIIAGLGWYFFISGLNEQIAVKQSQLDGLKVEIQRGQAVEQKHQEFLTQNKQLLSKLSTLKIILPEAKQTDQLLRQVQESAVASNLLIRKFQPSRIVLHVPSCMSHIPTIARCLIRQRKSHDISCR